MSAVAAPADKRFRRAHTKPTRHRRWRAIARRGGKYALAGVVAVFVLYRGGSVMAHADVLKIDHIVIHGNRRLSNGDVLGVLAGLRGENLMRINLDGWRNRLLASPWIKEAALRRSLPSTVDVEISERNPIALGRIGDALYLIDDRGLVIDEYGPQYAELDLPIVDGLAAQGSGGQTDETRADLLARLMSAVSAKPELARRLSQIDVTDAHNARVILSGDPALIYVGEDRFVTRLESYEDLAKTLRESVSDIDYVDLRFDDRIYVRPVSVPKGRAGKQQ